MAIGPLKTAGSSRPSVISANPLASPRDGRQRGCWVRPHLGALKFSSGFVPGFNLRPLVGLALFKRGLIDRGATAQVLVADNV
jgi:hypothetical protein